MVSIVLQQSSSCKELPLGIEALEGALERAKSCLKEPAKVLEGCEVAELLSAQQPRTSCGAKRCYQQQQQLSEGGGGKSRLWSLVHTATSLHQAEYPSCMLKHQQGAPSTASALASPTIGAIKQPTKDSLVTNLRNWVDGLFHDPLFWHSTLNQALSSHVCMFVKRKCMYEDTC
ncbi:UNVERIFIED_CONTAM: hypothetical protein K2H54_041938 [Gekko kuhli]